MNYLIFYTFPKLQFAFVKILYIRSIYNSLKFGWLVNNRLLQQKKCIVHFSCQNTCPMIDLKCI